MNWKESLTTAAKENLTRIHVLVPSPFSVFSKETTFFHFSTLNPPRFLKDSHDHNKKWFFPASTDTLFVFQKDYHAKPDRHVLPLSFEALMTFHRNDWGLNRAFYKLTRSYTDTKLISCCCHKLFACSTAE